MKRFLFLTCLLVGGMFSQRVHACTGITLRTVDNYPVTARTIEWAATPLTAMYVVVPRGQMQQSVLPDGAKDGKLVNFDTIKAIVEEVGRRRLFDPG